MPAPLSYSSNPSDPSPRIKWGGSGHQPEWLSCKERP
jgi:hypothetical protein